MEVRESPTKLRPSEWPPKSPRAALMSSPSRKRKLEQMQRDRPTSPSPSRERFGRSSKLASAMDREELDEDEETLQLRLEAIQAQLKLKKLQKAKADDSVGGQIATAPSQAETDRYTIGEGVLKEGRNHTNIQVPLSPKHQRSEIQHSSPKRVQLGIDKGLKAQDISLRRPKAIQTTSHAAKQMPTKPTKSFNDRLAESRTNDTRREKQLERRHQRQNNGFGISRTEGSTKNESDDSNVANINHVRTFEGTTGDGYNQQATPADIISSGGPDRSIPALSDHRELQTANDRRKGSRNTDAPSNLESGVVHKPLKDNFVGFELTKRLIEPEVLSEAFKDKVLMSIPKLLKEVVSPHYDPPDVDDYVIYGIIAQKSTPKDRLQQTKVKSNADPDADPTSRSKFMALKLTDLKWEIDMFLFDSAFEQFWKLTEGTVVAILNPMIMPPKPHLRDTGKFNLKLTSSEDTILEIGMAKDLGFCRAKKQDGQECMQWLDRRKTEFCDFHVNLKVEKARASRMEINCMSSYGLFGRTNDDKNTRNRKWKQAKPRIGEYYDKSIGEKSYIVPRDLGTGLSSARLLDADDKAQGGLSAAERSRKRLAAMEKELELAKKLGSEGTGLGGEYMRLHKMSKPTTAGNDRPSSQVGGLEEPPDAEALGLVRSKTSIVTLSPVKGGRFSGGSRNHDAIGWSGAFKRGLPDSGKEANPSQSMPKKAKLLSTGKVDPAPSQKAPSPRKPLPVHHDDDDDDLDIV